MPAYQQSRKPRPASVKNSDKLRRRDTRSGALTRDNATHRRIRMYKTKVPNASAKEPGKLSTHVASQPVRIQPDIRWFRNTRLATAESIEKMRQEMEAASKSPQLICVEKGSLPQSLLSGMLGAGQQVETPRDALLRYRPYSGVLAHGQRSKRPLVPYRSISDLAAIAQERRTKFSDTLGASSQGEEWKPLERINLGRSARVWKELYKVIDSSDLIVQVLDARDPMGTRCRAVEAHVKKNCPSKTVLLLLNKADLIPNRVLFQWMKILSKEFITVAFRATKRRPFGRASLMDTIRQFSALHAKRKHVCVGFIGLPNVGKSSIINCLRDKAVCKTAPRPGETKVWQYIHLSKRIYLIDSPGVSPADPGVGAREMVLRGVVRPDRLEDPSYFASEAIKVAGMPSICRTYKLDPLAPIPCIDPDLTEEERVLSFLGQKWGKLKKGGDPDVAEVSKIGMCLSSGLIPSSVE